MAVRYSFECPECHAPVELSATQAGQEMSCASCPATFSAPRLGDIKKLPVIGVDQSGPAKRRNSGTQVKSWLFTGGLLLAVIACIAGYATQSYANKLRVEIDIEEIVAAELKAIDEAPPAEIYSIAVEAGKEGFQLEYSEVPYRTMNIKSGIMQSVAWGCWGVTGVGVLMLLSSFFVRK